MKKVILIFTLLFLTSCGARKVAINNTEQKKDSTAITNVKVITETKKNAEERTNILAVDENEEITITPIDASTEIIVDGKTFKNVVIKRSKNKSSSLYTNDKKVSETKLIDSVSAYKVVKNESVTTKTKNVDKKEVSLPSYVGYIVIFWLIVLIIIIVRRALNR